MSMFCQHDVLVVSTDELKPGDLGFKPTGICLSVWSSSHSNIQSKNMHAWPLLSKGVFTEKIHVK